MKNANYIVLVLAIATAFFSCKPEGGEITQTGIVFYPSSTWGINKQILFGSSQEGNLLNSLYFIIRSDTTALTNRPYEGRMEFDLDLLTIKEFPVIEPDSIESFSFTWTSQGKYIAFGRDVSNPNPLKQSDQLMLLDKNLKILSEKQYTDRVKRRIIHLEELSNGNFIMLHKIVNETKLLCFDSLFKTVWQKIVPQTESMKVGNNSIILFNNGNIDQYDYTGKFLRKYVSSKDLSDSYFIENYIGVPDGFLFYGKVLRGDKYDLLFFIKYDKDMNLVKKKLIETREISADPNFVLDFNSNMLFVDNAYYFVGKLEDPVVDYTKPLNTAQASLIKLDDKLDLVFSKPYFNKHLIEGEVFINNTIRPSSFLIRHNNQILTISNASWKKQIGVSFIKTDFDGNIIN